MNELTPEISRALLWVYAAIMSLGVGWLVMHCFKYYLEKYIGLPERNGNLSVPGDFTGIIERAFFTGWVGLLAMDHIVVIGALTWLGLKLASNWHRHDPAKEPDAIARTWVALLSGLISVGLAILIGARLNQLIKASCAGG